MLRAARPYLRAIAGTRAALRTRSDHLTSPTDLRPRGAFRFQEEPFESPGARAQQRRLAGVA
jgi:hypothetical protein